MPHFCSSNRLKGMSGSIKGRKFRFKRVQSNGCGLTFSLYLRTFLSVKQVIESQRQIGPINTNLIRIILLSSQKRILLHQNLYETLLLKNECFFCEKLIFSFHYSTFSTNDMQYNLICGCITTCYKRIMKNDQI